MNMMNKNKDFINGIMTGALIGGAIAWIASPNDSVGKQVENSTNKLFHNVGRTVNKIAHLLA